MKTVHLDMLEQVRDYLATLGVKLYLRRRDDGLPKECVMARLLPPSTVARYQNRSRLVEQSYQVIVRAYDPEQAMELCQGIADHLDMRLFKSENGSYRMVSHEIEIDPQEMKIDDANLYAYVVYMKAEIYR